MVGSVGICSNYKTDIHLLEEKRSPIFFYLWLNVGISFEPMEFSIYLFYYIKIERLFSLSLNPINVCFVFSFETYKK